MCIWTNRMRCEKFVSQLKSESAPVSSNTHGYNHFNGSWLSTYKLPDGSCFKVATQFIYFDFFSELSSIFFPLNAQSYVSVLCASSHLSVTLHYDLSSLVFRIWYFCFSSPNLLLSCMLSSSSLTSPFHTVRCYVQPSAVLSAFALCFLLQLTNG